MIGNSLASALIWLFSSGYCILGSGAADSTHPQMLHDDACQALTLHAKLLATKGANKSAGL